MLDHATKAAKKVRISGGGKCNFSNYYISADNYLSQNPHFCKSALSRYQYFDFLALLAEYDIPWHERDHGQLFCDRSAMDIVELLLAECHRYNINIILNSHIETVQKDSENTMFIVKSSSGSYYSESLVIASGGLSVAKMGASDFGLKIARQFGLNIIPTHPGLVPFSYNNKDLSQLKCLSGIALKASISINNKNFKENLLFTHKGISGPVVLQISSYWQKGDAVSICLLPNRALFEWLKEQQQQQPDTQLKSLLSSCYPRRLVAVFCRKITINRPIKQFNINELECVSKLFQSWVFRPAGTEGYRVAEVTVGGVDTNELSSKTMQARKTAGLYFIGEVVDVTGHLGGYNFQWAWASGYCAGQYV